MKTDSVSPRSDGYRRTHTFFRVSERAPGARKLEYARTSGKLDLPPGNLNITVSSRLYHFASTRCFVHGNTIAKKEEVYPGERRFVSQRVSFVHGYPARPTEE